MKLHLISHLPLNRRCGKAFVQSDQSKYLARFNIPHVHQFFSADEFNRCPPMRPGPYFRLLNAARISIPPKAQIHHRRGELLLIKDLGRFTGDPLWILVDRLRKLESSSRLSEALFKNGISFDELRSWTKVIKATDIDQAMSIIEGMKALITQPDGTHSVMNYDPMEELVDCDSQAPLNIRKLPVWLVAYVASHHIRTPAQAGGALLKLVFHQLPLIPPKFRPSLLVIVVLSLARYSLLVPIRRVIDVFLTIPVDHPRMHFNLLLQAIARLPRSEEAANLVVTVLEAMTSRKISLTTRTYHVLLTDRFVTLQLTKLLQTRMVQQGFTPSAAHLASFVRIFAKFGAIHDANKYMEAVRLHEAQRETCGLIADKVQGVSPYRKASTHYMHTFGYDRASAFEYLSRLLKAAHNQREESAIEPTTPTLRLRRLLAQKYVDVYDWTTAFSIAARQWKTSSEQLIRLFNASTRMVHFRPTVATYTVLIRGLIMRRSYADAANAWDRLLAERLVLDRQALGAGVKALTLSVQPLRAFRVLETFGARPGMKPARDGHVRRGLHPWLRTKQRPVRVDTMTIHDFMVALLRIQRPDVIFRLWDHMETLFNVNPDSYTLEILCRAARLAAKLDSKSLAGNVAMLNLSNPFRKPQIEPTTREEMVHTIEQMLSEGDINAARGIWKNAPAVDGVRKAFKEIIFGNWPEMRDIKSPAHAVRRPDDGDTPFSPFREIAQSIVQVLSSEPVPEDEGGERPIKHPPHINPYTSLRPGSIVPSEATFRSYILLLGTTSYQHEIPLVLAYMRALNIHPRRQTICFALIFWAEVSLRGPLFEDWAERRGKSEYGKLYEWIVEWVGEAPKDYMMAFYMRVVARARDPRFKSDTR